MNTFNSHIELLDPGCSSDSALLVNDPATIQEGSGFDDVEAVPIEIVLKTRRRQYVGGGPLETIGMILAA